MGIDAYGLVRQPDGTLGQTTSEETQAAIAQILSGHRVTIDDVREFKIFQSNRASSWEDDERAYAEWEIINNHAFWWALDGLDLLMLGRCTSEVREVMLDYDVDIVNGRTEDKELMLVMLTVIFDQQRANLLVQILDGIFWS